MALLIMAKLLVGWLVADFIGGVLHWLEDRVLTEDTPLLGTHVVASNRQHHAEPLAFVAKSFLDRNGTTWITAGAVAFLWWLLLGSSWVWAGAVLGGMLTSMVHYLTHLAPSPGSLLRALQDVGLIQSVRQHAQHHRPPADRRYCVLTDWLNPLLDHLRFWCLLERLLGVTPEQAA